MSAVSPRESARQEMPEALRKEVRLLGDLLGQVLSEEGGVELLEDVEKLRRTVIAAYELSPTMTGPWLFAPAMATTFVTTT